MGTVGGGAIGVDVMARLKVRFDRFSCPHWHNCRTARLTCLSPCTLLLCFASLERVLQGLTQLS